MDHQAGPDEKLPESPKRIWLAPACNVDERTWCEDDIGCCDECGEPTVKYLRADLVEKAIRDCPSLDENGYVCQKSDALKAIAALG